MKRIILTLIGIICFLFSNGQSPTHLPLDSLTKWVSESIGNIYSNDNIPTVQHFAHVCLIRAKVNGATEGIVEAYQNLAYLHYMIEDERTPDSTLYYDQMALEVLKNKGNQAALAKAYSYVGNDYTAIDDYKSAQFHLLKAVEIYESINDLEGRAKGYESLGFLYKAMKDYKRSIEYGEKGVAILKDLGVPDSVRMGINWFGLVESYIELQQLDKALEAANYSIEFIEPYSEENVFAFLRAYSFRGEAYKAQEKYESALKDFRYAWEFGKAHVSHDSIVGGYQKGIAEVLRLQNKCEEAIPYYENFLETMKQRDASQRLSVLTVYAELADCYEETGSYQKALVQQKVVANMKDSLANNRYENLESELIQKYESNKKDEQIALQTTTIQQQLQIQWLSIGVASLFALLLVVLFLIYRRNQKINTLLQSLNVDLTKKNQQNELLLKEIHHRIKNNLQTISSLLSLQSAHIEDPKIQGAVEQSQNRVRSIALIHQKLYQSENLAVVEMKGYLQVLGETIADTFGMDMGNVEIEYPNQPIELDIDTAIPIGLIANELLTNAFKYAFPDHRKGNIKVSLEQIGNTIKFLVKDNGIGLKEQTGLSKPGFGSQLIQLLVLQIEGKMKTHHQEGWITEIEFPLS
jgi:two-component sensor histidine kinase